MASPTPPVAEGGFAEETVEPPASDQPIDPEPPFPVVLEDRGRPDNEGEGDFAPPEGGDDARVQEPAAQPSDARAEEENLQPPAASPPQSAAEARGDTDVAATQPFVPEPLPDEKAAEPNATSTDAPFLLSDAPADEAAPRFEVDKDGHANEDALVSDTRELHDPLSERSQEEAAASEPEPDAPAAPITAELIWSGPEETEAAPEEVHAAAPSASQAEAPTESRPEILDHQRTLSSGRPPSRRRARHGYFPPLQQSLRARRRHDTSRRKFNPRSELAALAATCGSRFGLSRYWCLAMRRWCSC